MSKIAMITGASSGIGYATAFKLAEMKYDLILAARRLDRLEEMSNLIHEQYSVRCLTLEMDVREQQKVSDALANLDERWRGIEVLINNAGLASGLDSFMEADLDDWNRMIDTNIKGLLFISKAVAPLMAARGGGRIINIGSIAGKEVYPNGNVYCGSKHFVDAITRAMRIELLPYHITVGQIAPGAVETEFSLVRFKGDSERASKVYQGFEPLSGQDVAEAVEFMLNRPNHVSINDLVITPSAQASVTVIRRD
jgi:3-hydroxy acid dehydrogenase / malonic semialdehyde reductase